MLRKAILVAVVALSATVTMIGQDPLSKFNGTWKSENGKQIRKLEVKGGVIYMVEDNGRPEPILRQYPTNGELVMPDNYGVWAKAKAKGHVEGGNKVVVDTETETFGNWHDEWTMSTDGKTYQALRVSMGGGRGGAKGPGAGGAKAAPMPETFTRIE